jgi:uncharacterized protein YceK
MVTILVLMTSGCSHTTQAVVEPLTLPECGPYPKTKVQAKKVDINEQVWVCETLATYNNLARKNVLRKLCIEKLENVIKSTH